MRLEFPLNPRMRTIVALFATGVCLWATSSQATTGATAAVSDQSPPSPTLSSVPAQPSGLGEAAGATAPAAPMEPGSLSGPGNDEIPPAATTAQAPQAEPAVLPEAPAAVAEVVNSLAPTAPGVSRRFENLLAAEPDPATPATATAPATYNVPIEVTPKVEGHMRFFHTAIRDRFEQWLMRLGKYKRQVEEIFLEFDLPSDLVFLSLVESGFNPHAYSRARATGPWQFMQGTAKVYGLRVDQYVDERRDPIKSTVAAAHYLRDLYDLFGAWPLAMAAYNAGEGKVLRALQKTQARSFDEIARTRHLKNETKEYVPRFMAATIIAKNPDRYGFPPLEATPHQFDEVVITRSIHLRDLAAVAGVSFEELERLNPELRRFVTPPGERYHLKVPPGTKHTIEPLLDRVMTWKGPLPSPKRNHGRSDWYKVRAGDTLLSISKRFRLSLPELKARNNLSGHRTIKPGDRLRIGP
jgi:membrane-bound lytic murein transglycosylase D